MKVVIDQELCEGNAVCEALAPALFEVDNDFHAHLLTDEIDESHRQIVLQAAAGCPRLAIRVSD